MAVSRRGLLHHGVLAALAFVARPLLALDRKRTIDGGDEPSDAFFRYPSRPDSWQNHASALERLSRESFAAAVGTNFKALDDASSQPVWLTLHAVEDLPRIGVANLASMAVAPRQSSSPIASSGFVLVFGSSAQMPQGTRLFQHDVLGRFALFIVPEGDGAQVYSAVVNRLDHQTIIAVPFEKRPAGGNGTRNIVPAATTPVPATSSDSVDPSPRLFGSRDARSVLRD